MDRRCSCFKAARLYAVGISMFHVYAVRYDRASEIVFLTWSFLVTVQVRFPVTTYIAGTGAVEITRKYRGLTWNYAEKGPPCLFLPSIFHPSPAFSPDRWKIYCICRPFLFLVTLVVVVVVVGPRLSTPLNCTYMGSRNVACY